MPISSAASSDESSSKSCSVSPLKTVIIYTICFSGFIFSISRKCLYFNPFSGSSVVIVLMSKDLNLFKSGNIVSLTNFNTFSIFYTPNTFKIDAKLNTRDNLPVITRT